MFLKTFDDFKKELKQEDPKTYAMMELVGKIIAARDRKGLTQRELSALANVPQKTISRIENGLDIPKVQTLIKLANALDLRLTLIDNNEKNNSLTSIH